jgi:hypothetical protein
MATTHSHHTADHHDHAAAHHVPGTMEIEEHERTFDGFVRLLTWGAASVIVVLIFLALANA